LSIVYNKKTRNKESRGRNIKDKEKNSNEPKKKELIKLNYQMVSYTDKNSETMN